MDFIIGQKQGKPNGAPRRAAVAASPAPAGPNAFIVDGDQTTFMADVVEASRSVPVLGDFWATWCGPCKQLTPALEKVVRSAGGRLKLVKIDIDKNRSLVQQLAQLGLPLQSVPTVAAFWQGQIADLFQGALPESEGRRFGESLLNGAGGTMPAADLDDKARAALEAGALRLPSPGVAAAVLSLALLCSWLGYWLYAFGLRAVEPSTAVTLLNLMPVLGAAFSVAALGESVTGTQILGGAVVLGGVWLVVRAPAPGSA
jgi:thiol-disulfide isomerase/thioredoxin